MPRFYVRGFRENMREFELCTAESKTAACDLAIFPEMFLSGYHGEMDNKKILDAFAAASADAADTLFVFGAISEDGFNRQYAYLGGKPVAHYDKVHLFRPNGEDQMWRVGSKYVCLEREGLKIGLATCNDVRFPEQGRALKLKHNINMLVYPALWPWTRDHIWSALLKARAIENGIFVVGSCIAGISNGKETFDGAGDHVFDPLGDPVYSNNRVYELDLARLSEVLVDTREEYIDIAEIECFRTS